MARSKTNPKVDLYLSKPNKRLPEMEKLRTIVLECGLTEELKWGKPCYTFEDKNIVIIQGFKEYCALLFFKGYLLKDPDGVLQKTGENTVVGRQIRFNNAREVATMKSILKKYIHQAIEVEKAGVKGKPEKGKAPEMPEELKNRIRENDPLKKAFDALTPGRQRAYFYYFSAPKQPKTRESRIEASVKRILSGKGLNDR